MKQFFWVLLIFAVSCQQQNIATPTIPETEPQVDLSPTEATLLWSDINTWDSGALPTLGDDVLIPEGKSVLLDQNPPALNSLTIEGSLVFADTDINLSVSDILIKGRLEIGSPEKRYLSKAIITLTGTKDTRSIRVVKGAVLSAHGEELTSWTQLNKTAYPGEQNLTLSSSPDWRVGDEIVVASTDFDFEQAEAFRLSSIRKQTLTLESALTYMHWGELQDYEGVQLDERAEVGRLSRNIVFQGDETSLDSGIGGHIIVTAGGAVFLDSVELRHMGQRGEVGRYPLHWHMLGDSAAGQYLKNASVHHTFNRCVTVHASNGVLLSNNVAYHHEGHCFFLEDGAETDNIFRNNLAISTFKSQEAILPTDERFPGPASFWITNPDNLFEGNVAAGSAGSGFWFALPENPTGPSVSKEIWPRFTPLGGFRDNVAHSNHVDGFHIDSGPKADVSQGIEVAPYDPRSNPRAITSKNGYTQNASSELVATFETLTAYKNRRNGLWTRGRNHVFSDAIFADNAAGATLASEASLTKDSLFVGESLNFGTAEPWMISAGNVGLDGRSLPRFWQPEYTIRGFEFYDGDVHVENSHFAGFTPNSQREAAGLSYLEFTDFTVNPENSATNLSFAEDTKEVYFATRPVPSTSNQGEDGYRTALFLDKDGSVTGKAEHYVTVNSPLLTHNGCSEQPDWNAQICSGRYASLRLINEDTQATSLSPLNLIRSDNVNHTLIGTQKGGLNNLFTTNVLLGRSYHYDLNNTPKNTKLILTQVNPFENVVISLPYSQSDVFIYRDYWIDARNLLTPATSLEALRASGGNQYFLKDNTLHLKLLSQEGRNWAALDICKAANCQQ